MKGMKKYYTQKIMWYLLTLVFAVLLNFILPRLMPGDPVSTIASKSVEGMTDATAIQKVYEDYAAKFGINKPMYVQFFTWVKNALRGDFWHFFQPVSAYRIRYYFQFGSVDHMFTASGHYCWMDSW